MHIVISSLQRITAFYVRVTMNRTREKYNGSPFKRITLFIYNRSGYFVLIYYRDIVVAYLSFYYFYRIFRW